MLEILKRKELVKFNPGIGNFLLDYKKSFGPNKPDKNYRDIHEEVAEEFGIVDTGKRLNIVKSQDPEELDYYWSMSGRSCRLDSGTISSIVVVPDLGEWWMFWSKKEGSPFFPRTVAALHGFLTLIKKQSTNG